MDAIILTSPLERSWKIDLGNESFGTIDDQQITAI